MNEDTKPECYYCHKTVKDKLGLKTKVISGDTAKTVNFCDTKCFEKQDQWPKFNVAKKKNKESVDIFDQDKFPDEKALFSKYFTSAELALRLAIWIMYLNEVRQAGKSVTDVQKEFADGYEQAVDKKLYLKNATDVFDTETLVILWCKHFEPDLDDSSIEDILDKYRIKNNTYDDNRLFNALYKQFVDKNWKKC